MKIKDAELLKLITGNEKIPVSNGSDKPATITVNLILEKTKTSTNILEITYDELKNLKDNSQLVPELKYRMIDYETIVLGDDVRSAGHVFDLILTAKSENKLYDLCLAKQSERDTEGYFSHSDLASWKVYYTMDTVLYSHVPRKGNGVIVDLMGGGEEYSQYYMTMYCEPLPNGNYLWDGAFNNDRCLKNIKFSQLIKDLL